MMKMESVSLFETLQSQDWKDYDDFDALGIATELVVFPRSEKVDPTKPVPWDSRLYEYVSNLAMTAGTLISAYEKLTRLPWVLVGDKKDPDQQCWDRTFQKAHSLFRKSDLFSVYHSSYSPV